MTGHLLALFSFHGRLSRRDFWVASLGVLLPVYIVNWVLPHLPWTLHANRNAILLAIVFSCSVVLLSAVSLLGRRLHDRNHSAWWLAALLIPLAGIGVALWILVECFRRGTPDTNRYDSQSRDATNNWGVLRLCILLAGLLLVRLETEICVRYATFSDRSVAQECDNMQAYLDGLKNDVIRESGLPTGASVKWEDIWERQRQLNTNLLKSTIAATDAPENSSLPAAALPPPHSLWNWLVRGWPFGELLSASRICGAFGQIHLGNVGVPPSCTLHGTASFFASQYYTNTNGIAQHGTSPTGEIGLTATVPLSSAPCSASSGNWENRLLACLFVLFLVALNGAIVSVLMIMGDRFLKPKIVQNQSAN